jgi:hypothetical protein
MISKINISHSTFMLMLEKRDFMQKLIYFFYGKTNTFRKRGGKQH